MAHKTGKAELAATGAMQSMPLRPHGSPAARVAAELVCSSGPTHDVSFAACRLRIAGRSCASLASMALWSRRCGWAARRQSSVGCSTSSNTETHTPRPGSSSGSSGACAAERLCGPPSARLECAHSAITRTRVQDRGDRPSGGHHLARRGDAAAGHQCLHHQVRALGFMHRSRCRLLVALASPAFSNAVSDLPAASSASLTSRTLIAARCSSGCRKLARRRRL